jgi:hypothetical protein
VDFIGSGLEHFREGFSTTTDRKGIYRIGPQPDEYVLFAYTDEAYTIATARPDQTRVDLRLSRWAKIEGVYKPTGRPQAGTITTFFNEVRDPRSTFPRFHWQFPVTTDSDGRYVVPRVPHFNGEPCIVQIGTFGPGDQECRRWLAARFEPGKTTRLDVSGSGRMLMGKALPASSTDAIEGSRGFLLLTTAMSGPATEWPATIAEGGRNLQPVYRTQINPDGSFSVPDVPPGSYDYAMTIYNGSAHASGSGSVIVAEGSASSPVQLEAWRYVRSDRTNPSPIVPDSLGQTLDGKPISLGEFRGKYVVIFVWDSCSGSADAHLPALNALGQSLGSNERVKLISINCDATSCGMIGVPHQPATLDDPAWLRGCITLSQEAVRNQLFSTKWPTILIVSPQGKVVARDLDGKDVHAKVRSLMGE